MISAQDVIDLVVEMRSSQKEYFRTRSQQALAASKRLEKLVDAALDKYSKPTLFDKDDDHK